MEVYGDKGYIFAPDAKTLQLRNSQKSGAQERKVTASDVKVYEDPFVYLAAVVRGKETIPPYGVYSQENNLMVVRILEAARESARTGKTVELK
jgi:predicted dehydrogenase